MKIEPTFDLKLVTMCKISQRKSHKSEVIPNVLVKGIDVIWNMRNSLVAGTKLNSVTKDIDLASP